MIKTINKTPSSLKSPLFQFMAIFFFSQFYNLFGNSFMIPRFKEIGLSLTKIGLLSSMGFFVGIIGQIFLGFYMTKYGKIRNVYLFIIIMLSLAICVVYSLHDFPIAIFVLFQGIIGFSINTIVGLLDTWALGYDRNIQEKYGVIRACTSLGWAVSGIIVAILVNQFGFIILPLFSIGLLPVIIYIAYSIPDLTVYKKKIKWGDLRELINCKPYKYTVLMFILIFLLITGEITLTTLKLSTIGDRENFGYFYASIGLAEIPLMILFHRIIKIIPAPFFIIIGIIGYILRLLFFSLASVPIHMFAIGIVLGSFSFSPLLLSSRFLIKQTIPENYHEIGMMMGIALSWGLTGMISASLSGWMIETIGLINTYFAYIIYAIVILIIAIFFVYYYQKNEISNKLKKT